MKQTVETEWISVEDGLPEEMQSVIIVIPKEGGGYYIPFGATYSTRNGFFSEDGQPPYTDSISHWAQMIQPPTEK